MSESECKKSWTANFPVLLSVLFAILIGGGATGKSLRFVSFQMLWVLSATLVFRVAVRVATPKKEDLEAIAAGELKAPGLGCAIALLGFALFACYGYLIVRTVFPIW